MGKIKLAVAGETLYAGRLTECIRKNAPEYLEVLSCRTVKELSEKPDILLFEQGMAIEEKSSGCPVQIQLVDDRNIEEEVMQNQIFRYQKGSEILRQIFRIYEQNAKKNLVFRCKTTDIEMTAFYAPGGHELLLPFSISYAILHGKDAKALCLNLSEFSGMKSLFGDKDGTDLSDLFFGIRQKKERFLLCLQSVLHHAEHFDYVLPPENPGDLQELQEEDLTCLLTLLQEQTEYKKIIWICGTLNQAVKQIMECCSKVFCVTKENAFGKYRKAEFERFLQKETQKSLREKVQYVQPQMGSGAFVQGIDILTQLQSGEFADQVRNSTQ